MAELAWPEDIGHGTFTGRFGFMDADSHDPDRAPDITSATGGTVTITPSIRSVRYTGAQGPMILAARPAKGVIDSEGYLCTATADGDAGDRGMVFPATDDTDLNPTDWTYEVSIILDGQVRIGTFNVKLPTDSTVDLSLAAPVPSSGGTAIVVDPTTAIRAEAAADRAETAADEAEGYAPTFAWDGTKLVIDGEQGPDLEGPPGPSVESIDDVPGLRDALPATTEWESLGTLPGLTAGTCRFRWANGQPQLALASVEWAAGATIPWTALPADARIDTHARSSAVLTATVDLTQQMTIIAYSGFIYMGKLASPQPMTGMIAWTI